MSSDTGVKGECGSSRLSNGSALPDILVDDEVFERDLFFLGDHNYMGSQDIHDCDTQAPPQQGLPDLETAHRTHVSTAVHVPKSARSSWAQALTGTIWEVVNNWESKEPWIQLLIISRCILPARQNGHHSTSHGSEVLARIRWWKAGEKDSLWKEAVARERKFSQKRSSSKKGEEGEKSQMELNASRSMRLIQEGQFTQVAQTLTSRGIDQKSEAARLAMLEKHPSCR